MFDEQTFSVVQLGVPGDGGAPFTQVSFAEDISEDVDRRIPRPLLILPCEIDPDFDYQIEVYAQARFFVVDGRRFDKDAPGKRFTMRRLAEVTTQGDEQAEAVATAIRFGELYILGALDGFGPDTPIRVKRPVRCDVHASSYYSDVEERLVKARELDPGVADQIEAQLRRTPGYLAYRQSREELDAMIPPEERRRIAAEAFAPSKRRYAEENRRPSPDEIFEAAIRRGMRK